MGELAHDGGLAQKVLPLFLSVARLQCLDSHCHLFPPWRFQNTAVHLAKLPCNKTRKNTIIQTLELKTRCPILEHASDTSQDFTHRGLAVLQIENEEVCAAVLPGALS